MDDDDKEARLGRRGGRTPGTRHGNGASAWNKVVPFEHNPPRGDGVKAPQFTVGNQMAHRAKLPTAEERRQINAERNWWTLSKMEELAEADPDSRVQLAAALALHDRTKDEAESDEARKIIVYNDPFVTSSARSE